MHKDEFVLSILNKESTKQNRRQDDCLSRVNSFKLEANRNSYDTFNFSAIINKEVFKLLL